MPVRRLRVGAHADRVVPGLARIRKAMELPVGFPPEVEREGREASTRDPSSADDHNDRTDTPFITIDPAGSMDLDQAFHAQRSGDGFTVHYAIADPGWFIEPGGAIDRESRRRGQTLYSPDQRVPLYPTVLSEGAASLLPGRVRPSLLWTVELNERAEPSDVTCRRSLVRSTQRFTYEEAQAKIDSGGERDDVLQLLRTIGERRKERERERGGMNLELPEQEVVRDGDRFHLRFRGPLRVEEWNAQISLLTGMSAASLMLTNGIGLLRTMPTPDPAAVVALRAGADLVGIDWPEDMTYQGFISKLDPSREGHASLLTLATRLFRGTAYTAFEGAEPEQPRHHAIGAPYAHATAPLRRLVDRFVGEICVALSRGQRPPSWVTEALPEIPELMKTSNKKEGELERRSLDLLEALVLSPRLGEAFEAVIVEEGKKGNTIQICEPAVLARCKGDCGRLGERVRVLLTEADLTKGMVVFERSP